MSTHSATVDSNIIDCRYNTSRLWKDAMDINCTALNKTFY